MDIYNPQAMPRYNLEIPEEFRKICRKLCQDESLPRFTSNEDLIQYLVANLDLCERKVVEAYIVSLFALNLSDRELLQVMQLAGSDLMISGEEGVVKEFFGLISSALDP